MTLLKQEACINVTSAVAANSAWCVYEHQMIMTPGAPPQVVYVAACKLIDVFHMIEARNNSEWIKLADVGAPIMIRIIMTTDDRREAMNFAVQHVKSFPVMPRCNLHGYNVFGSNRTIVTSDGRAFTNQAEAARALGCTQSAVSQHLKGKAPTVKGVVLSYKVKQP